MTRLQLSEMGPRHLTTTWTLLRPKFGQWAVSEVRHYDNDGEIVAMPQRSRQFRTLDDAVKSIPSSAVEQNGASTLRSWRFDYPITLAS